MVVFQGILSSLICKISFANQLHQKDQANGHVFAGEQTAWLCSSS